MTQIRVPILVIRLRFRVYNNVSRHNDLPWSLREHVKNDLRKFDFTANLTQVEPWKSDPYSHTDLPRIREGRLGGQVL